MAQRATSLGPKPSLLVFFLGGCFLFFPLFAFNRKSACFSPEKGICVSWSVSPFVSPQPFLPPPCSLSLSLSLSLSCSFLYSFFSFFFLRSFVSMFLSLSFFFLLLAALPWALQPQGIPALIRVMNQTVGLTVM